MTTTAQPPLPGEPIALPYVEQELTRLLHSVKEPGEVPARRARMSNLVVFCDQEDVADRIEAAVPEIVAAHPARVLLLEGLPGPESVPVTARVNVWCRLGGSVQACSEEVRLRARGSGADQLPSAVRGLLIGDLPTNLWWASTQPPPLAGPLLDDLSDNVQQIIYDSIGWTEPARGVAATASWLAKFENASGQVGWRVASDLNWRRLKHWRRLLGQALDPEAAPGAIDSVTEVLVEHGPNAVVQAWELVSWLALRLNWQVQAGKVQPGLEIAWQAVAPHGNLRVVIRRLAEGPPEIKRMRFVCTVNGKPGALNLFAEDKQRVAIVPEGVDAAPRTVTIQALPESELIARQLSDRVRDPVFRESMAIAQVFANSVLG